MFLKLRFRSFPIQDNKAVDSFQVVLPIWPPSEHTCLQGTMLGLCKYADIVLLVCPDLQSGDVDAS